MSSIFFLKKRRAKKIIIIQLIIIFIAFVVYILIDNINKRIKLKIEKDPFELTSDNYDDNDDFENLQKSNIILNHDVKNKLDNNKVLGKETIKDRYSIENEYYKKIKIKKKKYIDPYGIDLNSFIIDGMENIAINNNTEAKIDEWNLYTPPCPNLHPVKYSNDILNPVCENIGLPLYKHTNKITGFFARNHEIEIPYILQLHDITTQMEKWKDWIRFNYNNNIKNLPNYRNFTLEQLTNDEYHPFNYGYYPNNKEKKESDREFFSRVINSSMDEVPDPRRRRLFNMILFNSEFELLDLYLAEYYEIVDYFIIYESNSTFSGRQKPLYLTRTLLETDRYKIFRDKIIPITLPVIEVKNYNIRGPGFPREHIARRELIEKGLRAVHARHGDLFIHGDLDEMPKARLLSFLKKCGGWEHLQMGIGGGPKPIHDPNTKSYLYDKALPISRDPYGEFDVDYLLRTSLSFSSFAHEYSFHTAENNQNSYWFHPNLVIFDARRSLGQYPEFSNNGYQLDLNNPETYKYNNEYNLLSKRHIIDKNYSKEKNNINENNNDKRSNNEDEDEDYYNVKKVIELNSDEYDPYLGYSYSDNSNDDKLGEGYQAEKVRFSSHPNKRMYINLLKGKMATFWKSGWHLSTFLPTIKHFINKIDSYSHYNEYNNMSYENKKNKLMNKIRNNLHIFANIREYDTIEVRLPNITSTLDENYYLNLDIYNYNTWKIIEKEIQKNGTSETFNIINDSAIHEIPNQVWKNPICYSYMIDRDFGFDKTLWWEVIPKEKWNSVIFNQLNSTILNKISPKIYLDLIKI